MSVLVLAGDTSLSAAERSSADQLPIHIVYVNHVEVESVIDYTPPLINGLTYETTTDRYQFTAGQLEWEMNQADAVGAHISFHMSGAYAARAKLEGDSALWSAHLMAGHVVGVHAHSFVQGTDPTRWTYNTTPTALEIEQHWQDNHDLVGSLVGAGHLWVGESHYGCATCWMDMGYNLRTTEAMAPVPLGQHIVWTVERGADNVVTYPHFPQPGEAGWHGPTESRVFFDLRFPQLKKEFLLVYLEWLERERLDLPPQVWSWGWCNHGGAATVVHGVGLADLLNWLNENFVGRLSPGGNVIAQFVNDHELKGIFETYEASGGDPLPTDVLSDQFPYVAWALRDCGVIQDRTSVLGVSGVRVFEMLRQSAQTPSNPVIPVLLLYRETDGSGLVDISAVLSAVGLSEATVTSTDVKTGVILPVDPNQVALGSAPVVLEVGPPAAAGTQIAWLYNPTSGINIYTHVHRPIDFDRVRTYPGVVMVPGGSGAGSAFDISGLAMAVADSGFIVMHFDPDGRGLSTNGGTYTTEDYNGYIQQDGLLQAVRYVAALPEIDPARVGILSQSYGVTMASGVLARYPDDPPVRFLLDVEGPHNRTATAQVNGGHVPHDTADVVFWSEREADRFMRMARTQYLRLQTEIDHNPRITDNHHAVILINAATDQSYGGEGKCPWTRVNTAAMNNPNRVYTIEQPPVWIPEGDDNPNTMLGIELALLRELAGSGSTSGCCSGRVGDGNMSGDDEPTIGDVTVMIDAEFISGTCDGVLNCLSEADVNQSAAAEPVCDDITIGDITILIDYLFITGPSLGLPDCP
ncbi:MAG: hypothetical protein AB1772_11915 [Candidatus Zixiibacteriota bacterium]